MRTLIASMLAAVVAAGGFVAAPVMAQEATKTSMLEDGKQVDSLLLRYAFDATWVVDRQHVLMRDTFRDHYLVTLETSCDALDMQREFKFVPVLNGRVRASLSYELRNYKGAPCQIARIETIDSARAAELRATVGANG